MKNKKNIFIGIGIAVAAILIIGIFIGITNKNKEDDIPKQMKPGYKINEDNSIDYYYTDKNILEVQENMDSYNYIGLSVVETYREYDENGEIVNFERTKDVYSEIDLIKYTDYTLDTSKWTGSGDVLDLPEKNFYENFGFDYKNFNTSFDIVHALLNANNISITLESDIINEDDYEEYGQIYYKLNDDVGIIDKLLEDIEYDEIVDKNVHWCIGKDTYYARPIIENIGASVVYKKDNKCYMKTVSYECYYLKYEDTVWNVHIYE